MPNPNIEQEKLLPSGESKRTLKECLARFMDPAAFTEGVAASVKFTSKAVGKTEHDKLKARRDFALKRADAAIRFFLKEENVSRLDGRIASAQSQTIETLRAALERIAAESDRAVPTRGAAEGRLDDIGDLARQALEQSQ